MNKVLGTEWIDLIGIGVRWNMLHGEAQGSQDGIFAIQVLGLV